MDVKKALEETGGDVDKAIEVLRKMGIAKAEKKVSRTTKEGLLFAASDETALRNSWTPNLRRR